jgi:hypothetical protein
MCYLQAEQRHFEPLQDWIRLAVTWSDPAKQAAQVVKHHVFNERTVITYLEETPGDGA